jgi:hypothetical protein
MARASAASNAPSRANLSQGALRRRVGAYLFNVVTQPRQRGQQLAGMFREHAQLAVSVEP